MLFQDIFYIDEHFSVVEHAYVGVNGKRISYLDTAPPPNASEFGRAYNGKGKLLVNGFFNAHSHTPMGLLRGYGENMSLQDWLNNRIFPFEAHLTYHDIYWSTLLCSAEMLRYGIVSTTDMYMNGAAMGDGFRDGGVKANFSIGTTCFDQRSYQELPQYAETLSMADIYHGLEDGRLKVDFSLHAEYTSRETTVCTLAEAAAEHGFRMQVHVSETAQEVAECRERHLGKSPVKYFSDCGIFDVPTTAAHCVHVDDEDISILAQKNVAVATCPKSNLKLASGVCPATKMLAKGVNVALGTDSVSSNNNLNMLEEMRVFALLQKGFGNDPTAITPAQALASATLNGAKSQGRSDCGLIRVGNRADLVLLDTEQPHMKPVHDQLNNLVYSATGCDVCLTMVDGVIRYENGDWPHLDIEKIYAETEQSRLRILDELKQEA